MLVSNRGTVGSDDGQLNWPLGVAVASGCSVYVTDMDCNRIQKFTSEGVFVTKWGTEGNIAYVAVAPDGSVYVADQFRHSVQKFTSEGMFVSKWGTNGTGTGEFDHPTAVAVASDGSAYVADSAKTASSCLGGLQRGHGTGGAFHENS